MPAPISDWDPLDSTTVSDPLPVHAELRSRCPVAYSDQWGGFWSITRYADICAAARDADTFSSAAHSIPPIDFGQEGPLTIPIQVDPPDATTYRRLLAPYFTPRHVESMEDELRDLVNAYLDPVIARGHAELVEEFTYPYTANVIAQCVLRAPSADWKLLKENLAEVLRMARSRDGDGMVEIGRAMDVYLANLVRDRRAAPLDPETDFISGVLAATIDDQPLTEVAIAAIVRTVFLAGHETTGSGLGSAILHLAQNPNDQARLRADPSAIPRAIEEILRCYSPVQQLGRRATRDVELHGRTIRAGDSVGLMWLSGNHDEERFPDADRCIIDRMPNPHVAFGFGAHRCLGAPLARIEIRIAIEELLKRTTHFEPRGPFGWSPPPAFGPMELPIRLT